MSIPPTSKSILKDMGLRLCKARQKKFGTERGSAKKCADALEITPQTWNDYEAGKSEIGFGKVLFFAAFFGVSPCWLLTGEGEMEKKKERDADNETI